MDSFQVTLPSNACSKTFPNNRPEHYEIELMSPLHLEGPWEVALIDIMFRHPGINLSKTISVGIEYAEVKDWSLQLKGQFEIIPQYFPSPDVFCQRMNKWCKDAMELGTKSLNDEALTNRVFVLFTYEPTADRITISSEVLTAENRHVYINFDQKDLMERMLGIDADLEKVFFPHGRTMAKDGHAIHLHQEAKRVGKRPPLFEAFPLIFVYTDLIKYQIVGDIKAPLLAVLPVSMKRDKQQVYWNCNPQSFNPVVKSDVRTVEIRLCTETGESFPLIADETVIARLHFRRRMV